MCIEKERHKLTTFGTPRVNKMLGIGIQEDEQSLIYESFYRGGNTHNIPGTGVGLYVVKEAVNAHQGSIECTSVVGKGTNFTVTLPRYSDFQSKDI